MDTISGAHFLHFEGTWNVSEWRNKWHRSSAQNSLTSFISIYKSSCSDQSFLKGIFNNI